MRPRTSISARQRVSLRRALSSASNDGEKRRLRCLHLRASSKLSTKIIARRVGFSVGHVRKIWSRFLQSGLKGLRCQPRGGRRNAKMSIEDETRLLRSIASHNEPSTLELEHIKWSLKMLAEVALSDSAVSRLLRRHRWRRYKATVIDQEDWSQRRAWLWKPPKSWFPLSTNTAR